MIITFSRESCTFKEFSGIPMTFYDDFSASCFLVKAELKKLFFYHKYNFTSVPPKSMYLNFKNSTVSALSYFFLQCSLDYWGCVVRCETDFVPFLENFDQNTAKQRKRRTAKILQFDKLNVRGLVLMVK